MSEQYPYECNLDEKLVALAEKELNEKVSWRLRDIQALRGMVEENKALKCPLDCAFLLRFLRARKFDYDRAYQLLINHYTVKATNHQILDSITPSNCVDIIDAGIIILMPSKDEMGRRVVYIRFGRWNPVEMQMMRLLQITMLTMEHAIRDEETQVRGVAVVVDVSGVGMSHLRNIDTNYISTMTHLMQDAFPMRIKGIHFINEPSIFAHLFTLIRPFLTHKMLSRHHFHGSSLDSLHRSVGVQALPKELGGELAEGDVLSQSWKNELMREEDYFKEMQQYHIQPHNNNIKTTSTKFCYPTSY